VSVPLLWRWRPRHSDTHFATLRLFLLVFLFPENGHVWPREVPCTLPATLARRQSGGRWLWFLPCRLAAPLSHHRRIGQIPIQQTIPSRGRRLLLCSNSQSTAPAYASSPSTPGASLLGDSPPSSMYF